MRATANTCWIHWKCSCNLYQPNQQLSPDGWETQLLRAICIRRAHSLTRTATRGRLAKIYSNTDWYQCFASPNLTNGQVNQQPNHQLSHAPWDDKTGNCTICDHLPVQQRQGWWKILWYRLIVSMVWGRLAGSMIGIVSGMIDIMMPKYHARSIMKMSDDQQPMKRIRGFFG